MEPDASREVEASAPKPQVEAGADRVAELEDRLRRALADADNQRKRTQRQMIEARQVERAMVAAAWLPIVDNLERALEHADPDDPVAEGVRTVRDQCVVLLSSLGYRRHDETGVAFDPQRHEAVGVVPDGSFPEGTVVEVLRPGYGDGASQLRPASVVVSAGQG